MINVGVPVLALFIGGDAQGLMRDFEEHWAHNATEASRRALLMMTAGETCVADYGHVSAAALRAEEDDAAAEAEINHAFVACLEALGALVGMDINARGVEVFYVLLEGGTADDLVRLRQGIDLLREGGYRCNEDLIWVLHDTVYTNHGNTQQFKAMLARELAFRNVVLLAERQADGQRNVRERDWTVGMLALLIAGRQVLAGALAARGGVYTAAHARMRISARELDRLLDHIVADWLVAQMGRMPTLRSLRARILSPLGTGLDDGPALSEALSQWIAGQLPQEEDFLQIQCGGQAVRSAIETFLRDNEEAYAVDARAAMAPLAQHMREMADTETAVDAMRAQFDPQAQGSLAALLAQTQVYLADVLARTRAQWVRWRAPRRRFLEGGRAWTRRALASGAAIAERLMRWRMVEQLVAEMLRLCEAMPSSLAEIRQEADEALQGNLLDDATYLEYANPSQGFVDMAKEALATMRPPALDQNLPDTAARWQAAVRAVKETLWLQQPTLREGFAHQLLVGRAAHEVSRYVSRALAPGQPMLFGVEDIGYRQVDACYVLNETLRSAITRAPLSSVFTTTLYTGVDGAEWVGILRICDEGLAEGYHGAQDEPKLGQLPVFSASRAVDPPTVHNERPRQEAPQAQGAPALPDEAAQHVFIRREGGRFWLCWHWPEGVCEGARITCRHVQSGAARAPVVCSSAQYNAAAGSCDITDAMGYGLHEITLRHNADHIWVITAPGKQREVVYRLEALRGRGMWRLTLQAQARDDMKHVRLCVRRGARALLYALPVSQGNGETRTFVLHLEGEAPTVVPATAYEADIRAVRGNG